MISHRKNFIFIHVPKTGGNSVQEVLKNHSEQRIIVKNARQDGVERFEVEDNLHKGLRKHSRMIEYQRTFGRRVSKYFVFTTIRNPFDRLVSFYCSPHRGGVEWSATDFEKFCLRIPPIEKFLYPSQLSRLLRHYPIDKYIRFENLNEDFREVCRLLDIPERGLMHRNKSLSDSEYKSDYRNCYSEELRRYVEKKHRFEIGLGSYEF